ncbi:MAG: hypothetical protein Q8R13_02235 [bacterium]|nr:hypothetical protein [bacterium]MDZ4296035.1 hypothetical protein [Patescibacteria group bacterium]
MSGSRRLAVRLLGGLACALALTACATGKGELSLGFTGGAAVGTGQDVRVTGGNGSSLNGEYRGESPDSGPFAGLTFMGWHKARGPSLGFRFDLGYWRTDLEVEPFHIEQDRLGLIGMLMGRYPITPVGDTYLYGGIGGGAVRTSIEGDGDNIGPAVGALGGVTFPLAERLRLRLEVWYLLTPDASGEISNGARLKTSGNGGSVGRMIFGPHKDTAFLFFLGGVDLLF